MIIDMGKTGGVRPPAKVILRPGPWKRQPPQEPERVSVEPPAQKKNEPEIGTKPPETAKNDETLGKDVLPKSGGKVVCNHLPQKE
jgi:hypothetical protein